MPQSCPLIFDPRYLIFALPALMLGLWAQWRVQSAVNKYSVVATGSGLPGAQIARRILDYNGLCEVRVEQVDGFLSDHYDPRCKVVYYAFALTGLRQQDE